MDKNKIIKRIWICFLCLILIGISILSANAENIEIKNNSISGIIYLERPINYLTNNTVLNHSKLNELLWSQAGHIIDTDINMNITNLQNINAIFPYNIASLFTYIGDDGGQTGNWVQYLKSFTNYDSATYQPLTTIRDKVYEPVTDNYMILGNKTTRWQESNIINMYSTNIYNSENIVTDRLLIGDFSGTGFGNQTTGSETGLVLSSNFDNSDMDDISIFNNDGTSGTSVSYSNGKISNAYFTDGGTDWGYYDAEPEYNLFNGDKSFSVNFWSYFNTYPIAWYQESWLSQDCAKGYGGAKWILGYENNGANFGKIYYHNGNNNIRSDMFNFDLNTWGMFTITYDVNTNIYSFYYNGALTGQTTDATAGNGDCNTVLQLGNAEGSGASVNGGMDELTIWNITIDSTDVSNLYNYVGMADTGENLLISGSTLFKENITAPNICYSNGSNCIINNIGGGMYNFIEGGYVFPITSTDVYYNISNLTSGELNNVIFNNNNLTIQTSGVYKIEASLSSKQNVGIDSEYGFGITKQNSTGVYNPEQLNGRCYAQFTGGTSYQGNTFVCRLRLNQYDNITLSIDDESDSANDLKIKNVNLIITRDWN
jgi:hypothetical protein